MEQEQEIWKDIKFTDTDGRSWDLSGKYQVSNMGRVKNAQTQHILKPSYSGKKYLQQNFKINGKIKQFKIHRLVAHMFVENPDPKEKICVNHINEDTFDNRAENLEWVTYMENNHHKDRIQRIKKAREKNPWHHTKETKEKISHKVVGINLQTNEIVSFNSITDASIFIGLKEPSSIGQCCRGKRKQVKGYRWMYLEDYEKQYK